MNKIGPYLLLFLTIILFVAAACSVKYLYSGYVFSCEDIKLPAGYATETNGSVFRWVDNSGYRTSDTFTNNCLAKQSAVRWHRAQEDTKPESWRQVK